MTRVQPPILQPSHHDAHEAPSLNERNTTVNTRDSFSTTDVSASDAVSARADRRPRLIVDFQARKPVYKLDWFPATDAGPNGPDGRYNMAGPGGTCRAYDRAFGKRSEQAELQVFSFRHYERSRTSWFGHCDKAAIVAATMLEPKRSVVVNGVVFEPRHIIGLLQEVADTMCRATDFRGERYNGPYNNIADMSPLTLLKALQDWSKQEWPVIFDKDRKEQVWNQSYDKGKVYESSFPFAGMPTNVRLGPGVSFLQFEIQATGVEDAARVYQAIMVKDRNGNVVQQQWFGDNPDFAWRAVPVGDLMDLQTWDRPPAANQHNKQISPLDVGRIFLTSVAGEGSEPVNLTV